MEKKVLVHIIILFLATIIIFFWVTDETLNYYSLQLSALLLMTLVISHRIVKPASFKLVESLVSTMAVLLVASATGGVASPLFFLNYFLLFELTFLLEPIIPLFLSIFFVLFYFLTTDGKTILNYAELISFFFMTPLAMIFGNLYRKMQNQKRELQNLNKKVVELEEELINEELGK